MSFARKFDDSKRWTRFAACVLFPDLSSPSMTMNNPLRSADMAVDMEQKTSGSVHTITASARWHLFAAVELFEARPTLRTVGTLPSCARTTPSSLTISSRTFQEKQLFRHRKFRVRV